MGRPPRCEDDNTDVKKGPWTPEENKKLVDYIQDHGHGNWKTLPKLAGLNRCGKSCRLRWVNYLRPGIKRGGFDEEEEEMIIQLHSKYGNKWSVIAMHLPGRTDNEIKNYWNTNMRKKLQRKGIDPATHCARPDLILVASILSSCAGLDAGAARVQAGALELARMQLAQSIIQAITSIPSSPLLTNDLGLGLDRTQSHDEVIQTSQFGPFYGNSGSSPQHSGTDSVQSLCSPFQEMGGACDHANEMFQISHDNINMPASSDYSGTDFYGTWDHGADLGEIFSNDLFPEGFFNYGL